MQTILVIDDDDDVREVIRVMLESGKYRVLEARNGSAGINAFREHRPNAVIVDIFMPDKDGIETVRELRLVDPQARIIAMSGRDIGRVNLLKAVEHLGADYGLKKPFQRSELLAAVERVLPPGSPEK
jgi:DNA-binding response OmpR family regulator